MSAPRGPFEVYETYDGHLQIIDADTRTVFDDVYAYEPDKEVRAVQVAEMARALSIAYQPGRVDELTTALQSARARLERLREGWPTCAHCGEQAAVCLGNYDEDGYSFACDECCGHGNEDGHCERIADIGTVTERYALRVQRAEDAEATAIAERDDYRTAGENLAKSYEERLALATVELRAALASNASLSARVLELESAQSAIDTDTKEALAQRGEFISRALTAEAACWSWRGAGSCLLCWRAAHLRPGRRLRAAEGKADAQLASIRLAARVFVDAVDALAATIDDSPAVMATAPAIGDAQAALWESLGLDLTAEHMRLTKLNEAFVAANQSAHCRDERAFRHSKGGCRLDRHRARGEGR
jgi:hypothetical protein